jgi:hypothetical protein
MRNDKLLRLATLVQLEKHCIACMNFSFTAQKKQSAEDAYREMIRKIRVEIDLWKRDDEKDFEEEKYGKRMLKKILAIKDEIDD